MNIGVVWKAQEPEASLTGPDPSKGHLLTYVHTFQVGLVQFVNFTVADCGAGPKEHVVNGKDHGGGIEFAWIRDDRRRLNTSLTNMAGKHLQLKGAFSSIYAASDERGYCIMEHASRCSLQCCKRKRTAVVKPC